MMNWIYYWFKNLLDISLLMKLIMPKSHYHHFSLALAVAKCLINLNVEVLLWLAKSSSVDIVDH